MGQWLTLLVLGFGSGIVVNKLDERRKKRREKWAAKKK